MTRDEQSALKEMRYILKHYQKEELDVGISTIRTALSLINKLQKENEHLKEQLLISNSLDNMYNLYVSKDKIRDKIKQLEKSPFVLYGSTIEILKELIGE